LYIFILLPLSALRHADNDNGLARRKRARRFLLVEEGYFEAGAAVIRLQASPHSMRLFSVGKPAPPPLPECTLSGTYPREAVRGTD
jgi:hypothetical protein